VATRPCRRSLSRRLRSVEADGWHRARGPDRNTEPKRAARRWCSHRCPETRSRAARDVRLPRVGLRWHSAKRAPGASVGERRPGPRRPRRAPLGRHVRDQARGRPSLGERRGRRAARIRPRPAPRQSPSPPTSPDRGCRTHQLEHTIRQRYSYQIGKYLLPEFCAMRMSDIAPVHVREWITPPQRPRRVRVDDRRSEDGPVGDLHHRAQPGTSRVRGASSSHSSKASGRTCFPSWPSGWTVSTPTRTRRSDYSKWWLSCRPTRRSACSWQGWTTDTRSRRSSRPRRGSRAERFDCSQTPTGRPGSR
jgi:hypothetical protein